MDFRRIFKLRLKAAAIDFAIILSISAVVFVVIAYMNMKLWIGGLLSFAFTVTYMTVLQSLPKAATVGMLVFKLKLTDSDKNKVSIFKAFLRSVCLIFTVLPFGFAYFLALADSERKTVFDYATNTMVVSSLRRKVSVETDAFLVGIGRTFKGQKFPVNNGIIIGRDPASCSVVFEPDEPAISRMHCCVKYNRQTRMILLEDINSSFGTYLWDGRRLHVGQTAALSNGDSFYLASKNNAFKVVIEK